MTAPQTEALRLADRLEGHSTMEVRDKAAAHLRRLVAENEALKDSVEANADCINRLSETVEAQQATIKTLNDALCGPGTTTTDNLTRIARLEAENEALQNRLEIGKNVWREDQERMRRLHAENEALRADAERWKPIESAPKDGRTVIIGRRMNEFGFVRGYGRFEGKPGSFCSGWISQGFDEALGNLGLAHPTHWMPLPPAPDAAIDAAMKGQK